MKKMRFIQWNVAIRPFQSNIKNNKTPYFVIKNKIGFWAADPFIIEKDGVHYVFAEMFDRVRMKGLLGVCGINKNCKVVKKWKIIIEEDVHLSFPYIWEEEGSFYLMPESSRGKRLCVYKAVSFPYKWVKIQTLLDGYDASDSIFVDDLIISYNDSSKPKKLAVFKKDNNSYFLQKEIDDFDQELRPGGKPSIKDGSIIIPFQNCKEEYGKSLIFKRFCLGKNIDDLSFHLDDTLVPSDIFLNRKFNGCIRGVHTYNKDNMFEVIDLKSARFSLTSLVGYILKKLLRR